jgi:acyl-CoA thioesterase I
LQAGENPLVLVLLKMLAPINVGLGYKQFFDKLYEELAAKYQILLLPFITAEVFLDKRYKLNDGLHFNQAGYQKIVESYLAPPIAEIVTDMSQP